MDKATLKVVIKWLVVLLVCGYVAWQFIMIDWAKLQSEWGAFEPLYLVAAFLVFFMGLFYLGLGWHIILWKMGGKLPYRRGIYIWIASQLGRFVPGKVVLVLGRAYMCEKEGIRKRVTSASVIYEMAFLTLAAFILFFFSTVFVEPDTSLDGGKLLAYLRANWALVCVAILVGIAGLHPKVFYTCVNLMLRAIKKEALPHDLRFRDSLFILAYYIGFWMIVGFGFFFVIKSVDNTVPIARVVTIAGIYASSCTIGFLMIFVPDGMGIREGAIKNLLPATGIVTFASYPFLIGLMVRVVSLAPEVAGFLLVRALTDTKKYKDAHTPTDSEEAEARQ